MRRAALGLLLLVMRCVCSHALRMLSCVAYALMRGVCSHAWRMLSCVAYADALSAPSPAAAAAQREEYAAPIYVLLLYTPAAAGSFLTGLTRSIRQHALAYVRIRQDTSAYVT